MSLTPNYSFIIPTGSDAVNLLTQCYPNFTSLDSILKPIQESGVTVATDTKVGTVHQLVRTDSSCNMFRFIATGNYASGDTFTVDGSPVTATAMDGTALPGGAFVINQSVVCVLNNLVLTVLIAGKETTALPASAVTYDNTVSGLTATNAQDAIDELKSDIPSNASDVPYTDTYSIGATNVQSALDVLANDDHHEEIGTGLVNLCNYLNSLPIRYRLNAKVELNGNIALTAMSETSFGIIFLGGSSIQEYQLNISAQSCEYMYVTYGTNTRTTSAYTVNDWEVVY